MYKGFRLTLNETDMRAIRSLQIEHVPLARARIDFNIDAALDSRNANWIMDTWFPKYDADIFMSHSHDDCELARKLAGQLESMGLKVFIDSEVWGYASHLLKKIDDTHCVKSTGADGTKIYAYEKRNKSTAHVNIMLAHALTRMIDLTECFVFLETPNSSNTASKNKVETLSPWLYHELTIARIIEPRPSSRLVNFVKNASQENLNESVRFKYTADTTDLESVPYALLEQIMRKAMTDNAVHDSYMSQGQCFLDNLYQHGIMQP